MAGLLSLSAGIALLSFATASTPYPLYGLLLALVGGGMGLAPPPLFGDDRARAAAPLPPRQAGVGSGLNSTARELGSALGMAVLSTVLTTRFARLVDGTRDAFTSGTSLGLRLGVALLLLITSVVAHQHSKS
jgi:predicted MFS family arabinose efflux permease